MKARMLLIGSFYFLVPVFWIRTGRIKKIPHLWINRYTWEEKESNLKIRPPPLSALASIKTVIKSKKQKPMGH